jgi:hypothetical protein
MANPPRKASPKQRGPAPTVPRYELVFERKLWDRGTLSGLFSELKSLAERSGSAIGDAYALAATAFLNQSERLEDLNAERKFQQRSKARASAGATASRLAK